MSAAPIPERAQRTPTIPERAQRAEGPASVTAWAVPGIPEIAPGDDLARLIGDALAADAATHPDRAPRDGDILIVTSKIVSKAEGRVLAAADREQAITEETVRVVATRAHDGGLTRIVENRLGVVGAAAGVDASNTPEGTVLVLPADPDASARALLAALRERFGVRLGVIVSDTLGRAWRVGQTDVAIGAAGVRVVDDLRGQTDALGRPLAVTQPAVGDELAALGDLVKGKASGCPVAVVRGAGRLVVDAPAEAAGTEPAGAEPAGAEPFGTEPFGEAEPFDTARSLLRTGPGDMFRLGTDEALAEGYRRGLAAGLALAAGTAARWTVVVPYKGGPEAKSRLGGHPGAIAATSGVRREALALAFLRDTLAAARAARSVERVLVVSNAPGLDAALGDLVDAVVADPGAGLNAAVAAGVRAAQLPTAGSATSPQRTGAGAAADGSGAEWTVVLVGDLPALRPEDVSSALRAAEGATAGGHPHAFVPDRDGTGTTAITFAPGAPVFSRFGPDSAAHHRDAGFAALDLPADSSLRLDVDDPAALAAARARLGPASRDLLG
jgi:coenzyme F420-0:L-glutamate ligase/coenzyme F420-1:gamma-L-glutamate ligase